MPEFIDTLPQPGRGGRKPDPIFLQFASELRANPEMWAPWPKELSTSHRHTIVAKLRHGRYQAFPPDDFEFAMRQGVLYVRYVGES